MRTTNWSTNVNFCWQQSQRVQFLFFKENSRTKKTRKKKRKEKKTSNKKTDKEDEKTI